MLSTLGMQGSHKSKGRIFLRSLRQMVVCWFTNQTHSSLLSATQYFDPLCNNTRFLDLFLFSQRKKSKSTTEYTPH